MTIIVSKGGGNAVKVNKSSFEDEDYLQQFICQNPDSVPLYDIKEDIKLLILAREFPVGSGAIDALGVDREGEIYIVETKLYKNTDKRAVVAQVLDYGANLWKYGQNFDDFISRIEEKLNKAQHVSLNERLREFYGLDEEETDSFRQSMRQHLSEGSFKFVVLMDALHEGLKDLIVFLNLNTRFSFFAVEVEYYKHEGFEIVIPKLFGAESPKVGGVSGSIGGKRKLTETEFLKVLGDNAGPEIAALAKQAIEEAPAHGLYVHLLKTGAALRFEDNDSTEVFNFGSIGKDGKLQYNGLLAEECSDLKIPRSIWQSYYDALVALIPGSKRVPFPTNPELDWVADENGNDWPSATPLLRNRKQWFKIIKDTVAQIRPLLANNSN
jgi:hypothetical protein